MLELQSLTKRYGTVVALDDLSLAVHPGEIFGFLGPNGAGKSTTIRLLLGLIAPTSGTAKVLGHSVTTGSEWRGEVGYLPGDLALWPRLTGRRTLGMLEAITGKPASWRGELLERLQLSDADLDRRVRTYSDGMRQKIGIVQALQCKPRLALLDEPTKGLDPLIQLAFYDIVTDTAKRGTTVFFSSHVLPEVERISTRVAMLRRGRLVTVGDVSEIRRLLPRRVTVVGREALDASVLASFGRVIAQSDRRVELLVPIDAVPGFAARVASMPIADLLIESQTLEDAFLEQYR
jgi:ABC-2 type transport system ATP-binding protein